MRKNIAYLVHIMIYSGYENGYYFLRLTHNIKMTDITNIFHDGYNIFGTHMLLIKKRESILQTNQ